MCPPKRPSGAKARMICPLRVARLEVVPFPVWLAILHSSQEAPTKQTPVAGLKPTFTYGRLARPWKGRSSTVVFTSRLVLARALRCTSRTSSPPASAWDRTAQNYAPPPHEHRGRRSIRCLSASRLQFCHRHRRRSRPTCPGCARSPLPRRPAPSGPSESGLSC